MFALSRISGYVTLSALIVFGLAHAVLVHTGVRSETIAMIHWIALCAAVFGNLVMAASRRAPLSYCLAVMMAVALPCILSAYAVYEPGRALVVGSLYGGVIAALLYAESGQYADPTGFMGDAPSEASDGDA